MTYAEKLKDPRWQKLRLRVMERDEFSCRRCGSDQKTLQVHHCIYHAEPWDSPLDELVTLCSSCHELVESAKETIGRLLPFYTSAFTNLAAVLELESMSEPIWRFINALAENRLAMRGFLLSLDATLSEAVIQGEKLEESRKTQCPTA